MEEGNLSQPIVKELDRLQKFLKKPAAEVLQNTKVYLKDIFVQNLSFRSKGRSQTTLLIPLEFVQPEVFVLEPEHFAFEDQDIVVFDKPAGLSTQPTLKSFDDHLYGAAIAHYTVLKPQKLAYVGLHHRLDRDTAGLVLMTKKSSANKSIADQFKDRTIKKKYLAIVEGKKPERETWSVDGPIARMNAPRGTFKFGIDFKKGDKALTHFKYLRSLSPDQHVIECSPVTGRTHQIRIHLSHSQLPILGDHVYGKKAAVRLQLFAYQLEFNHPKTGKVMAVSSKQEFKGV